MSKTLKKIIFLIITCTLYSCKSTASRNTLSFQQSNQQKNEVIFTVDERTEFFRTVFNLAAANELDEKMRPCETGYYKETKEYFKSYLNHPLLAYVLNNDNIRIDFSTLGLMYKDFESFEFDNSYLNDLKDLGLTEKDLNELKPLLLDFYQKTNFKKFFFDHQPYYKKAVAGLQSEIQKEQLFDQIEFFYQSRRENLKFIVFVELTNNANNKALPFYDHNNPNIRALILTNLCDSIQNPKLTNDVLTLDPDKRNILCHEISHIFTIALLEKYIGKLSDFKSLCKDCSDVKTKDFIDHRIISPLQAILIKRLNNDLTGEIFFETKCTDIRKEVYKILKTYDPNGDIPFETIYKECVEIIRKGAAI